MLLSHAPRQATRWCSPVEHVRTTKNSVSAFLTGVRLALVTAEDSEWKRLTTTDPSSGSSCSTANGNCES